MAKQAKKMAARKGPAKEMVAFEMDPELRGWYKDFAERKGLTFRRVVEDALRRNRAYPPPDPPCPPFPEGA